MASGGCDDDNDANDRGADGGSGNRDGFARSNFSCFEYVKLKKIPRGAGRSQPIRSRTAVQTSPIRAKVGRKKPFANRIRE